MNKIVKKINNLYILKRSKFLIMNKDGNYCTIQKQNKNDKRNQIIDWRVEDHLNGKSTLGVFAGSEFTKFICFDVDVKDKELSKWTVYKLIDTLVNAGISHDYIYTSFSGSKGYHVEVFFNEPIHNSDAEKFYLMVLNNAELLNIDYGQVEFRPTEGQGVKIPLGIHFKTGNKCWYCDYTNQLEQIKDINYVLSIKQLDRQYFYNLLNIDELNITTKQAEEFEEIKSKAKPLKIYEENIDEELTIKTIENLINEGLTRIGTRHNSLLKICKYYKYMGLTRENNKEELILWMQKQNKQTYTTEWKEVLEDINKIVDWTYDNNIELTIRRVDISVSKTEIKEILKLKGKNEKLLLYVMLIHSKRYATKKGIFYMTYKQMSELTGLSTRTAIRLVQKLEDINIIDVNRDDNIPIYNTKYKIPMNLPNKYKLNLLYDKNGINENHKNFQVCDKNCHDCFNMCLCTLFTENELKTALTKNNYYQLKTYKKNEMDFHECNN